MDFKEITGKAVTKFTDYMDGAGLAEGIRIAVVIGILALIFTIISLLMDKWEGDFRHKLLILVGFTILAITLFLLFVWLELNIGLGLSN